MLPFNVGTIVVIDPEILKEELFFGEVPLRLYDGTGKIVERKYMVNKKFMAYLVSFGIRSFWFKESELIEIRSDGSFIAT